MAYQLKVIADKFEEILIKEGKKGQYGGKGEFSLPKNHKAAMQVTKGGASCENCKFVNAAKHECKNKFYAVWNGGSKKLPDLPLDEICSDWWQSKK